MPAPRATTPGRRSPRLEVSPSKLAEFSKAASPAEAAAHLASLGGIDRLSGTLGLPPLGGAAEPPPGLAPAAVAANRALYGANELPTRKPKAFLEHLWEALEDETIRILVFSAVVSMVFGVFLSPPESRRADIIQACAIVLAVVVVSGVNSAQNWSKDKEFQSLSQIKSGSRTVTLRRAWAEGEGASEREAPIRELVVGDVLRLASGDLLPCDGLLLSGYDVRVDESGETGESIPAEKAAAPRSGAKAGGDPLLRGNTKVVEGEGYMLVTAVGTATRMWASIELLENAEVEETPLQERLDEMAGQIGKIGMAAGGLTFVVLTGLRLLNAGAATTPLLVDLIQYFIIGVAIVVVAVPEGLPLAVTIALAFSMQKMMADQCLVRTMKSCETMGSATYICSDKTGTLTENRMTVTEVMVGNKPGAVLQLHGLGREAVAAKLPSSPEYLRQLRNAICLNSTADFDEAGGVLRSPLEAALIKFVNNLGHPVDHHAEVRKRHATLTRAPFSKETKCQVSVCGPDARAAGEGAAATCAYVTGAPEVVVPLCTSEWSGNKKHAFNDAAARLSGMRSMTEKGLRVIALAYKELSPAEAGGAGGAGGGAELSAASRAKLLGAAGGGLTLLGLFAVSDPLRAGVVESVAACRSAGITVIMLTGDHKDTARSIAFDAGILSRGDYATAVMEGAEMRALMGKHDGSDETSVVVQEGGGGGGGSSEAEGGSSSTPSPRAAAAPAAKEVRVSREALAVLPQLRVLARCTPLDKFLVVASLQKLNEVVAVTGDGTNDAPALKKADVGLAMGIAGTEVAKEAADIVILDDNFRSIVAAVRWGRSIKENIRKFLSFQLTINLVALTLTFVSACTSGGRSELPLKPVQLLWVNLIMDSFAALALATEPPNDKLMALKPQGRDAPLITGIMWVNMLGHALLQTVVLLVLTQVPASTALFELQPSDMGNTHHDTIVFTTFVAMQWFNLFNCRSVNEEWRPFENFLSSSFAMVRPPLFFGGRAPPLQSTAHSPILPPPPPSAPPSLNPPAGDPVRDRSEPGGHRAAGRQHHADGAADAVAVGRLRGHRHPVPGVGRVHQGAERVRGEAQEGGAPQGPDRVGAPRA